MRISIEIDDELYKEAKKIARLESRSTPKQLEYWIKVGKIALINPELSLDEIKDKKIKNIINYMKLV